ncbi:hypothetical protein [Paenibacillus montanisoli]|uniref:Uncharacterized protein n=1 Tax=Paenibacillus montanisoli TaxID=2081970 RepID=A0A328TW63_9BACL|nr:hypothetical protein [Paenibacillus montanisoli]RAP74738.1 hypothetical protein DL346_22120 [Paenibacillus montanisoli]
MKYEKINYDDGDIGMVYYSSKSSFFSRWKAELIGELHGKRYDGNLVYAPDEEGRFCEQFTLTPVDLYDPVLEVHIYDDMEVSVNNRIAADISVCRRQKEIKVELLY